MYSVDQVPQLSMFVDPYQYEEKKSRLIINSRVSNISVPVIPASSASSRLSRPDSVIALTNLSALLADPNTRRCMGEKGIPYRMIPGREKSESNDEDDYPDLILESSATKIQQCLMEDVEHVGHSSFDKLDPIYFVPIINWLFLKLQFYPLLTDGKVCSLCQYNRFQKFMEGALIQAVLAIASMIFTPLWISATIVFWNTGCMFLEKTLFSHRIDLRTLSDKENAFVIHICQYTHSSSISKK